MFKMKCFKVKRKNLVSKNWKNGYYFRCFFFKSVMMTTSTLKSSQTSQFLFFW